MTHEDDDEKDWLGAECVTPELCPIEGWWEQIETGKVDWHRTDDKFPPLSPAPNYQRATYRYLGKTK